MDGSDCPGGDDGTGDERIFLVTENVPGDRRDGPSGEDGLKVGCALRDYL